MINSERKKGIKVKQMVKEGDPEKEIFKTVRDEKIDLKYAKTGHIQRNKKNA